MLPAACRITSSRDFRRVYRQGRKVGSRILTLYWQPNELGFIRFGFVVSKKIGRSVIRNRIKRLLREACRCHLHLFRQGCDVVLVAREGLKELSYKEIVKEVLSLSRQAKLLVNKGNEGL